MFGKGETKANSPVSSKENVRNIFLFETQKKKRVVPKFDLRLDELTIVFPLKKKIS